MNVERMKQKIQLKRKKRDYYFAIFQYCETSNSLVHYLYNNQFDGEYLLPEFRHLDFLYLLKGDVVTNDFRCNHNYILLYHLGY